MQKAGAIIADRISFISATFIKKIVTAALAGCVLKKLPPVIQRRERFKFVVFIKSAAGKKD